MSRQCTTGKNERLRSPTAVHTSAHGSFTHDSPKLETSEMPTKRRTDHRPRRIRTKGRHAALVKERDDQSVQQRGWMSQAALSEKEPDAPEYILYDSICGGSKPDKTSLYCQNNGYLLAERQSGGRVKRASGTGVGKMSYVLI